MSSDFLSNLASQLGDQFGSNNQNRAADIVVSGTAQRYGKLGDISNYFYKNTESRYLQEGYLRLDNYNAESKRMQVLFQEPDITVLVKKRAFSSLAENFDLSHMDKDEKLFYKATKILFANKCQQIAALERLSKIERVSAAAGELSPQLVPLIISLANEVSSGSPDLTVNTSNTTASGTDPTGGALSKLQSIITKIQDVYSFSKSSFYTTWLTDTSNIFKSQYGQGTGVIEFCNVTSISTNATLNLDGGSLNISISDPYNMMWVSEYDIEKALNDATNQVYNDKIFQFGQDSIDSIIAANTQNLNNVRAARRVGPIQFNINPQALQNTEQVVAVFASIGEQVHFTYNQAFGLSNIIGSNALNVAPESLLGSDSIGSEGLDPNSEVGLFSEILGNIYNSLQLKQTAQSIGQQNSSLTNYARRKMRQMYMGQPVIQSMDQVHIYIGSKSRLDNKLAIGTKDLFTGLNFLQNLNNTAAGFKDSFDALFNPNGNANFQLEKSIIVGPDFPNYLWTLLRGMFVNETSGAHVFGGVVTIPESGYSNGNYEITVQGSDMSYYLEQGRVNLKPAVDVFNGPLYDPLTPFKTSFDIVSDLTKQNAFDLLDENKDILATNSIKFKAGNLAGRSATEKNIKQQDSELTTLGQVRQVFYSPDGLVYKWKEGIGTFTQFSNSFVIDGDNTIGSPSITDDPFAGQDVMNAISLSITGQPYNFATFYKAAQENSNFGRDPQTGQDSAYSFYASLTRDLIKNNLLWGNFIPFKNLYLDEATFQKMVTAQMSILRANNQINDSLQVIQDLTSNLQFILGANPTDTTVNALKNQLQNKLQSQLTVLQNQYNQINNQLTGNLGNQGLNIIGNDVSFNSDTALNTDNNDNTSLSQPSLRKALRRKINFLTRRLSWQVRANEDKNLFIVDDSYDKDYDIQAFERSLGDINLFNSQFVNVKEKIQNIASLLNLEVFCDTQGHIRVRPPQYNKMPSSVFYRMFQLKNSTGIQIYPKFLETLFVDQLQSLQNQVEVIEDQIRLGCALLGESTDSACVNLIQGFLGGQQSKTTTGESGKFVFLTNEQSGSIQDFNKLYSEANPDIKLASINNTIEGRINSQANLNNVFTTVQRSQFIVTQVVNPLLNPSVQANTVTTQISQDRLNIIKQRLFEKTGQQVNIDQFESANPALAITNSAAQVPDIFKITNDISTNILQRQKLVKQLSNALQNAKEAISLDSTKGQQTANRLLTPDISPNSSIPEVFENMIEDESYDDLGPGSGKRYVIEDYSILDFRIRIQPPEYTMVEVKGQLDLLVPNSQLPQDLNTFNASGAGGNALVTAAAVDYDMWRTYGFKNSSSVTAPFLSDPQSQCAPYAATILSRARKNILQANLTIAGNEYMQLGDVIYLKSKGLLFYVAGVSHSFNYGGTFRTSLQLNYGHTPGDYIPTTLDVIGKLLYNNRNSTSYINYRQGNSFNQQSVGVIVIDKRVASQNDVATQLLGGNYGGQNAKILNNILYTTYFAVQSNKDPNSTIKATVELRVYNSSGTSDSNLVSVANVVNQILTGQYDFQNKVSFTITGKTLGASDVSISQINVSANNEARSPSQKAMDMVRNVIGSASYSTGSASVSDSINQTLFGYIIDVWITFTNISSSTN